jgi:hypothetical protein
MCPAPLKRWQPRHWQCAETIGSAAHSYRIAPHAQPPVIVVDIVYFPSLRVARMERSVIRDSPCHQPPDYAALHPGYGDISFSIDDIN